MAASVSAAFVTLLPSGSSSTTFSGALFIAASKILVMKRRWVAQSSASAKPFTPLGIVTVHRAAASVYTMRGLPHTEGSVRPPRRWVRKS